MSSTVAAENSSRAIAKVKPRGRPFPKGVAQTPAGRTPGVPNKATLEIKQAARAFVNDPKAQAKMLEMYREGKLNPMLVAMFYAYGYGQPPKAKEDQEGRPLNLYTVLLGMPPEFVTELGRRLVAASGQVIEGQVVDGNEEGK